MERKIFLKNQKIKFIQMAIYNIENNLKELRGNIIELKDVELSNISCIYAFWLMKPYDDSLLYKTVSFKGPGKSIVKTKWQNYIAPNAEYQCLYIGKTTKLKSRISMHLMNDTTDWHSIENMPKKLRDKYKKLNKKHKSTDFIFKRNSQCQFRAGFEHLFKNIKSDARKEIMQKHIGFSFFEIKKETKNGFDESINDRFYFEDLAIGYFRPWFNLDSER